MSDEPTDTDRPREIVELYLDRGRPDRALALVEELLRSEPEDPATWLLAARARLASGTDALAAAQHAVALAPESDVAMRVLAFAHTRAGSGRRGIEVARQAVRTDPEQPWNHAVLALCLTPTRPREALREAACAVDLDPHDPDLHVTRARVALAAGRRRLAREYAQKALELDPTSTDAVQVLGEVQSASPDARRWGNAVGTQLEQVRRSPADRDGVVALELAARAVVGRVAAVVVIGALQVVRLATSTGGVDDSTVRVVASVTTLVALVLGGMALRGLDADARAVVRDTARKPAVAISWSASGAALVLLAAATAAPAPLHLVVVAAVLACTGGVLAYRESLRLVQRHGGRALPFLSGIDLVLLGGLCAVLGAAFALVAILQPDGEQDAPLASGIAGAVLLALGAACFTAWARRRR